mgnify:CR=1 FL=1
MAFVHSKGTAVSLGEQDLTRYVNSCTVTRTAEAQDVTTLGNDSMVYAPGLKDGTATIEGIYDDTQTTGPGAVLRPLVGAPAVPFVWQPEGAGSGRPMATVDALVTSYEESSEVPNMVTFSVELQFSGDIVDTTSA